MIKTSPPKTGLSWLTRELSQGEYIHIFLIFHFETIMKCGKIRGHKLNETQKRYTFKIKMSKIIVIGLNRWGIYAVQ